MGVQKVILIVLIILFMLAGCKPGQSAVKKEFFILNVTNCTDYLVRTEGDRIVTLSKIIEEDYKPLLRQKPIDPTAHQGTPLFEEDVQLRNRNGELTGFIFFLDEEDKDVAGTLTLDLEVKQLNSLKNDSENTVLTRQKISIVPEDFKMITYSEKDQEKSRLAYVLSGLHILNWPTKPTECLAELKINVTNQDGYSFSSEGLITLIDYDNPQDHYQASHVDNVTGTLVLTGKESYVANLTKHPFLWKIEGKTPSYLYGTLHVTSPRVLTIPDVVYEAISNANGFYNEIDLNEVSQLASFPLLMLPDNERLENILPPELYDKVDTYLVSKGHSLLKYSRLKIWALAQILEEIDSEPQENEEKLDKYLYGLALLSGTQPDGLEIPDEQLNAFNSLSMKQQISLLNVTLNQIGKADNLAGDIELVYVQVYLYGDTDIANTLFSSFGEEVSEEDKRFLERLNDERNFVMAHRIEKLIRENPDKSYVFAVGLAHYPGEKGILKLLQDKGLKISRVDFEKKENCQKPYVRKFGRCYLPPLSPIGFITPKYTSCEKISDSGVKTDCYFDTAIKTSDISYCLGNSTYPDRCVRNVVLKTRKVGDCMYSSKEERDQCYYLLAYVEGNPDYCNLMSSPDAHALCLTYLAVKRDDSSFCDSIKLDKQFNLEFDYPSNYYPNENYFPGMSFKQVCRQEREVLIDMDFFYPFSSEDEYSLNYTDYTGLANEEQLNKALSKRDFTKCKEITYLPYRKMCAAIGDNEPSHCDAQEDGDMCYYQFALYYSQDSHCDKIKRSDIKDKCYGLVAVQTAAA